MKSRIAILAMLVAVGIGIVWLLTQSGKDEVMVSAAKPSGLSVAQQKAGPSEAVASLSLPTNQTPTVRGTLPFVVKSSVPIDKPLRLAIEAMGVRTVAPLAVDALLVEADGAARARLVADERFTTSGEYLPAEKVESSLAAQLKAGAETVQVSVIALTEADRELVRAVVAQGGGEILTGCLESKTSFKAKLPAALVAELVGRGDVQWLESYERPHLMNDIAVNPETMDIRPIWKSEENPDGLSGAGQNITTSDSGIDSGDLETLHLDLRDRVVGIGVVPGCSPSDVNGHGTHTAGSIVGNGHHSNGRIRGTAWGAHLWAWFCGAGGGGISTPSRISDLLQPNPGEFPAYIHSASWGAAINGRYNDECANFDDYVWEHPDYLPVIAAGNEGRGGAKTMSAPGSAKNVLTVGATQNLRQGHDGGWGNGNPRQIAVFSSRGPCVDGRIKPDVASPGVGVISTRSHGVNYSYGLGEGELEEFYAYDSGTSMATPLTAGSVALIREWLLRRDEFADEETETAKRPTAALMKAIITGGAKDVAVPDNEMGWGRVDIKETLYPADRAVRLIDRIPFEAGEEFIYAVETTNTAPLSVQLAWVDYPGTANRTSRQLVNDLDLVVEAAHDGIEELWYGNGGTAADTLNNVESVRLASAAPMKYIITVRCKTVLYDYEDGGAAALYIRGAFDPEANPEANPRVRIPERELGFRQLKQAVAAVRQGETIEVLEPVNVTERLTLNTSCTIVATNADARASALNVRPGAGFVIGRGARVLFQNLVCTNGASVAVNAGGVLALSGLVVPGPVTTADAKGLELAGRIAEPVVIHAPKMGLGDAFGTYSTSPDIAEGCADLFRNTDNDELMGVAANGLLTWELRPVDDADAVITIESDGERTNLRSDRMLAKLLAGDATISVRKTTCLGGAFEIGKSVAFVGVGDGVAVTNNAANPLSLAVIGGSLVVSNLTFAGFRNDKFIAVRNRGELLLEKGATITNVVVTLSPSDNKKNISPVTVESGRLTMRSGALITGCSTSGRYGGAINAWEGGAEVNLEGGTITGCCASQGGGGVYAFTRNGKTRVRISGDVVVRDNVINNGTVHPNDIEVSTRTYPVEVVRPQLSGYVGISNYNDTELAGCYKLSELTASEAEESAKCLHSNLPPDKDGKVLKAAVSGETFVWRRVEPFLEEGSPEAVVRLVYPDGTRQSYATLDDAFKYMTGACTVELLTNDLVYARSAEVPYDITFRSAPEVGETCCLSRTNDCQLVVPGGRSLILSNVCLRVSGEVSSKEPIIEVAGGALTLDAGAVVSGMRKDALYCADARVSPGIFVYDGGTLTMKEGSLVEDCNNLFVDNVTAGRDSGRGGGVTLSGETTTGYFHGGSITNCQAAIGGGLALLKNSKAYVSGDFTVKANLSAITNTLTRVSYLGDDIVVAEGSTLTLAAPLAESARLGRRSEYESDTNLVANVANPAQWTADALAADAAKFFRSESKNVRGVAVTNATGAKIVWGSALDENGSYRSGGDVYFAIPEAPNPDPLEPDPEPLYATPLPIAFKSIVYTNDIVTLVITDAVKWCNYRVFATDSLEGGFVITNSAGEYVAPVTNFQWKVADPEIKLEFPSTDAQRFWRAIGTEGRIP